MTLHLPELRAILKDVQYKPGWHMEVYDTEHQGIYWAVQVDIENSYHPGETVTLRIKSALPPMQTTGDFYRWLLWRLQGIEGHECAEWLRDRNGKAIFDPHAEGADEPAR